MNTICYWKETRVKIIQALLKRKSVHRKNKKQHVMVKPICSSLHTESKTHKRLYNLCNADVELQYDFWTFVKISYKRKLAKFRYKSHETTELLIILLLTADFKIFGTNLNWNPLY